METEEKAGAFETIGAALAGAFVVILIYLVAITVWTTAARAGGYGEYSGQSWAERAMSGDHSRVRGKPQYEPGGGYYREHYHGDRYSRGNHRIRTERHSHPHHRERGYSRVTHTHPVTHTHYYRPRYTHPRYTRHYYHWRPHHRPEYRRWQQYAWVKVPLYSSHGYRGDPRDLDIPERYRFDPDIRALWERERRAHLIRRGYHDEFREPHYYRARDRHDDRDDDRRRDCKPPLTHYGETRMREDAAKAQAQVGWSSAVGLEHGLKYANWKHARKKRVDCHIAGYKEEGVEKAMENFAKLWNRQEHWKSKCVVVAIPCAPKRGDKDDDGDDHDHDEVVETIERPGPTR
jgi:hypothetical protein